MAHIKTGFHSGPTGNMNGIGDYWRALSGAGVSICHKSADSFGPLYEILTAVPNPQNVTHSLIWRVSTAGQNNGYDYDVPPYHLPPAQAAAVHWQATKAKIPSEAKPLKSKFWIEPINEVDKNRADWLGRFGVEIARLANAEGYKVALFGWSSGEPGIGVGPEPEHWETAGMLQYLAYCQANPDRAAVSIHEYNFLLEPYADVYPWHIGRFQWLFSACDKHGIARPQIFITEWGWALDHIPTWDQAQDYLNKANKLYCKYPQIMGAALWNLGGGWGTIDDQTQAYITPMTQYALTTTYPSEGDMAPLDPDYFPDQPPTPPPGGAHKAIVVKAPQEITADDWRKLADYAYSFRHTLTASHDDTLSVLLAGNADSYAKIWRPNLPSQQATIQFLTAAGIGWQELVLGGSNPQPPPQAVDLIPYFQTAPAGQNGPRFVLQHSDGRTEDIQHQTAESGAVYIVKNSQYEELKAADGYIWRRVDTSPGNGQYYKLWDQGLDWSKWSPAFWEIGKLYERRPFVQFFNKSDCKAVDVARQSITWLKFAAFNGNWQSPSGIILNNVIELHWLLSPSGAAQERYWYAKGIGMVQWKNAGGAHSYVSELPQGRPDLVKEIVPCL